MKSKNIISPSNSVLVVVDVQEKLLPVMMDYKIIQENIVRLIRGFKIHNVPIVYTAQYIKGLGKIVEPIKKEIAETDIVIEKIEFSCFQNDEFLSLISNLERKNFIFCGIESHVCVLQTCLDAVELGYNAHCVFDAVSSRKQYDFAVAFEKMKMCNVMPTTVEMALFELTHQARTPEFKEISQIAKEFLKEERKMGFQQ
jgi:nicotinamidase-related amidase